MESVDAAVQLKVLCAGAVQGLVKALQPDFTDRTGAALAARFGAVGALREALLAGEAVDVVIVTDSMIRALIEDGLLLAGSGTPIGVVRTGIAVRSGDNAPAIDDAEALKSLLLSSNGVFFPDPVRSTAGIHFAGVVRKLGILEDLEPRFRTYPNGATAMRELAANDGPGMVGCTQVTEINYTAGVKLVGPLPSEFELATLYSGAIARDARLPALARSFIDALTGAGSARLRREAGFDSMP